MDTNTIRNNLVKTLLYLKYKDTLTDEEIETKINNSITYLNSNKTITTIREQSDITNSSDINKTTNELFLDLATAYVTANQLNEKLLSLTNYKITELLKTNIAIAKIQNKQDNYKNIISTKQNPIIIDNSFKNNTNKEKDYTWYKERYGEDVPVSVKSIYNTECNIMQLPKLMESNEAFKDNIYSATVNISNRYSDYDVTYNDPNNIIVENNNTWIMNILSNRPINVVTDEYNRGAVIDIYINFESVSIVNEILISPLSKYPMKIVKIELLLNEYVQLTDINSLDNSILYNTVSFKFENVQTNKIHIVLNQIHYERNSFLYSNITHKINTINMNTKIDNENKIFKPLYDDIENSIWNFLSNFDNNKLVKLDDVFMNKDVNTNVVKYNYEFGIKNIIPYNNIFDKCGIYVSSLIQVNNTIDELMIESDHLYGHDTQYRIITDIEYYINFTNNNDYHDWIPIFPHNDNELIIYSELLQMYDDLCRLRFNAVEVFSITRDGTTTLVEDIDYYLKRNENNLVYAVEIPDYDFNNIYSISYKTTEDSQVIKLNNDDNLVTSTEYFNCNNKNNFTLSNELPIPFDINNINIEVLKDNKVIYNSRTNIRCVENIQNNSISYINFTKDCDDLEFYIDKNIIYFNKQLQDNYTLKVTYKHTVNSFRLKAILRRNALYDKHVTPEIKNLKYIIKTK